MSTPLKFKELQLRNFMSFGDMLTTISLADPVSTLIVGENVDAGTANGAGKTTIINAICYALYNNPFDKIGLPKLLNATNGQKDTLMEVRLSFDKGDDEFVVYRSRGEAYTVNITKNGADITLDSVVENDKLLVDLIGISYDLFTKVVIFSGSSNPFLLMPVSHQRQQIEELFNITLLSEKAVKLKEVIKSTEGQIAIMEAVAKEQEGQYTLYQKQLKDAINRAARWDDDTARQLVALREEHEAMVNLDMAVEKELHELIDTLKAQETQLEVERNALRSTRTALNAQAGTKRAQADTLRAKATATLAAKKTELTNKLTITKRDRAQVDADVKKLETELEHLLGDKCPYCLQQYANAGKKLDEGQATLTSKLDRLAELDQVMEALKLAIQQVPTEQVDATLEAEALGLEGEAEQLEAQVLELKGQDQQLVAQIQDLINQRGEAMPLLHFKTLADALKAEVKAKSAVDKINDLELALNPHLEALEQLKAHAIKEVSYEELDALRKEVDHQQFLLKLLTDKNSFIRRKIINRTVPFLNSRLIHYTKELGLPHVVKFDDDMSCTVAEYGRELDYGNLSGGEKKRVNLALSLAFRDVLHHLHARVNCLFIDEIDGGLDGSGVENVFKLLKQKTRDENFGLWIISHRPEAVGRFDRELKIRKHHGFSRVVEHDGSGLEEEAA